MLSPPVPTGSLRRRVGLVGLVAVILAVVAGGWWVTRTLRYTAPRCTAATLVDVALTGEQPAALTCQGITAQVPGDDVAALAQHELGTSRLTGPQPPAHGWAIASWLVAHASRLGISRVHYDGRLWTVDSGAWTNNGPPSGQLSWERAA
jgi:hypothetical protein